jgi:hypothetical protein
MRLGTRLSVLSCAVMLLATAAVVVTAGPAAAAHAGPFQVINYNSGLCIDTEDAGTSNGTEIHQWTCRRQSHQLWHFEHQPTEGYFEMYTHHTATRVEPGCLTIPNWSKTAGADAKLVECFPHPWAASHQGFSLTLATGSALPTPGPQLRYRFINWFSQMCLEIAGGSTSRGAVLQQAPCNGSAQQLWIVIP